MPEVPVRNQSGEVVGTVALPDETFSGEIKEHLIHDVVVMQLANRRSGTASTKNRATVSGTTQKPWRQKGTGRARAGTRKSPLWRGGGVVFGPTPRSYAYKVPKKVRKRALRDVLIYKIRNDQVVVLDSLEVKEPKTKLFASILEKLGIDGSALVLLDGENSNLQLAAQNIPQVKILKLKGLNVLDLLNCTKVLLTRDAMLKIEEALS